MIDFYITEQSIRFASPVIAANSREYLTARCHFSGESWEGYSKWMHFRQGETVYDLNLVDDEISAQMGLSLSVGSWEVYLTGNKGESRLTTVPVYIQVRESGLIDEPLHQIPMSVAEQVDSKASLALEKAQALEEAVESGELDGKGFEVLGFFQTVEELEESITEPERGEAYGVGTQEPYDIYIYDGINCCWVNNGTIQGPKGDKGEAGATFSPILEAGGNLSWINDKGLENPMTVNIRGDKGDKGEAGSDGMSPFEKAVEEGFSGTEATFNWSLSHLASHAAQHKASGTDPLLLETENLGDGTVTGEKLAEGSVSAHFTAAVSTGWTGSAAPFTQELSVPGLLESDRPVVDLLPSADIATAEAELEAWGYIYKIVTAADKISLYATEKPTVAIDLQMLVVRK